MRIEYEDEQVIVVYKEAGLAVQTGRTSGRDLVSLLKNHLASESERTEEAQKTASGKGRGAEGPYLGIVHRLDQPVEGLLVFAKTPKAAASLSAQVSGKSSMEKIYRALVCLQKDAYPLALEGRRKEIVLTNWLLRDPSSNRSVVTREQAKGAKRAQLSFRTLEIRDGKALLEVSLQTGRHHQIRVQLAEAGMPIAGDRKYGGQKADGITDGSSAQGSLMREMRVPRREPLCLCAFRLSFRHPAGGKQMRFEVQPSFWPEKVLS